MFSVPAEKPCKPCKLSLPLSAGVFGIAGVSQLPAASTAGKDKFRKSKGKTMKFPYQERLAPKLPPSRRAEAKPRMEEPLWAASEECAPSSTSEVVVAAPELQSTGAAEVKAPTCAGTKARSDEKRRRWADIADDDDVWEDGCGTSSLSDSVSTRGSTTGYSTDTDCSDYDV